MKQPSMPGKRPAGRVAFAVLFAIAACGVQPVQAQTVAAATSSFGITQASGYLTVDTGAGLVFKVNQSNGDITSIKYKGSAELQSSIKGSQMSSGIGATVSYTVSAGVARITLTTSTLVHYLLVRAGENNIYMGTYITAEPTVGELRWVTRLNPQYFTSVPAESDVRNNVGNAESTDIFLLANGETRSKFYGNQRAMELGIRGATGPNLGVFMVYGNRESSSGGPFHRDIQNQTGFPESGKPGGDLHVYNYMNSGHNQTEAFRTGFHGPYALMFTDGTTPTAAPDMSWMEGQGLSGWFPAAQRGKVVGRALYGFDLTHKFTVGFANATAQYWAVANAPNGNFTATGMKPGTYTMTVYKDEIAVYTSSVTVGTAATTTLNPLTIVDPDKTPALWRIGTWDGTPKEFLNGTTINVRHPSDVRNASWGPTTYAVGSPAGSFPAAQWRTSANSPTTITFTLTQDQVAAHQIRIGVTAAYNNGRPQIKVNNWNPSPPAASTQPDSRSITIGTYRGNNTIFTYNVPSTAFVAGTNTITISVASGTAGTGYTSPGFAYDALDML